MAEREFNSFAEIGRGIGLEIRGWNALDGGVNNRVYELETQHPNPLILRTQPAGRDRYHQEALTIGALQASGFPALPAVLEIGTFEHEGAGFSYSLEEKLSGISMDKLMFSDKAPEAAKLAAIRSLGVIMRNFHTLATRGCGLLDANLQGEFAGVHEWADGIRSRLHRSNAGKYDLRMVDNIAAVAQANVSSRPYHAVICHGDFMPKNVLVNEQTGQVNGLIDFEHSKAHFKEIDFAYWKFYWQSDLPLQELLTGYSLEVDNDLVKNLAILRGADAAAYWLEQGDEKKFNFAAQRVGAIWAE